MMHGWNLEMLRHLAINPFSAPWHKKAKWNLIGIYSTLFFPPTILPPIKKEICLRQAVRRACSVWKWTSGLKSHIIATACSLRHCFKTKQFTPGPGSVSAVWVSRHSLTPGNRNTLEAETKPDQNNCQWDIWDDLCSDILLFIVFSRTWPTEFIRKYHFIGLLLYFSSSLEQSVWCLFTCRINCMDAHIYIYITNLLVFELFESF